MRQKCILMLSKYPMKKLSFILPLTLVIFISQAQYSTNSYKEKVFKDFLQSETYVQLTQNEEFDSVLSLCLSKYWKVTPYKLVSADEMSKQKKNPRASLIVPLNLSYSNNYYSGSSGSSYSSVGHTNHALSVVMGGQQEYTHRDLIGYVNYDEISGPFNTEQGAFMKTEYRLKDVISTLNHALEIIRDNKCEFSQGGYGGLKYLNKNFYNKDAVALKTKTLYIKWGDVEDGSKILKTYPYKCKVLDPEEYYSAVASEKKDIIYLHLTHGATGGITLIDPYEHKCVGGILYDRGTTLDAGDLKAVAKLADGEK
jgi:hypothetical protein